MITTNKTNQLDFIRDWSEKMNGSHKPMSENEFSVTELIKDATAIVLRRRHYNAIECDLQDYADINAGTAVHESIEKAAKKHGWLTEKAISLPVKLEDGRKFKIYGKLDLYHQQLKILSDIKNTKEATYSKNSCGQDDEWLRQTRMYACLLRNKHPKWFAGIDKIMIQARITDLSVVRNAKSGEPTDKWRLVEWAAPTEHEMEAELSAASDRAREVMDLSNVPDEMLPICSEKYRYAESVWKIYKRKSKNSEEHNKVACTGHAKYESFEEAQKGFEDAGFTPDMYVIEKVGGESLKCRYFCDCRNFCPHYKRMMEVENG